MTTTWYRYRVSGGGDGSYQNETRVQETKPDKIIHETRNSRSEDDWTDIAPPAIKEFPEGTRPLYQHLFFDEDTNKWNENYDLYHTNFALHLKSSDGTIRILLGFEGQTRDLLKDGVVDFQFVPYPEELDVDTRQHGENLVLGLNKVIETEADLNIENHAHNDFMLGIVRMKLAGGQEIKDEHRQALLDDDNFHNNLSTIITHEDAQKQIDSAVARWTATHNALGSNHGARTHQANKLLSPLKDKTGMNLVREFDAFHRKLDALLSVDHQLLLRATNLFLQRQQHPLTLLTGEFRLTLAHVRDILLIRDSFSRPRGQTDEYHPLPKYLRERG